MAEQDTSPDTDLQLKKSARRRLVGAAALALLAIIVLPMVMDHEPRPPVQDIQVRIPSQDGSGAGPISKPPVALAPSLAAAKPETKPEAKPEAKPEVKVEPAVAPKPEVKPEVKPEPKPETKPAPVAVAPVPVAEKPAAKPAETAPSADKTKAAATAGQWVVQLGAYKDAGNIKLLLAKLKGIGVQAYTEKFDTPQGLRTRVRAGPYPSKEAAEKAQKRIKIIGVDGPVAPR